MRTRKRQPKLQPVTFVPVTKVFKPMVEIVMTEGHDLTGWADREKRKKWVMRGGEHHIIDEDKAREFVSKGYATFADPDYEKSHKLSDGEIEENLSTVTRLHVGGEG